MVGKSLELVEGTPVKPVGSKKGRAMWIYDGEQWIKEGASESEIKPESRPQDYEMFYPELQVVEVTISVPKTNYVPPYPAV